MTRRTTLCFVCVIEALLIVFFMPWSAFSSSLSQFKKEGFVPVEICVKAMINGSVLQRRNQTHSNNTYFTVYFQNRVYGFTYQRDTSDHQSSCLSWVETNQWDWWTNSTQKFAASLVSEKRKPPPNHHIHRPCFWGTVQSTNDTNFFVILNDD